MALLATAKVTHVSYILLLYSISFLLFLFVSMLLHLYATHAWPLDAKAMNMPNGTANGHVVDRRVRDAEEFELEGLMSDDEGAEDSPGAPGRRKENGRIAG